MPASSPPQNADSASAYRPNLASVVNAANSDLGNYDFVINISGGTVVVWTARRKYGRYAASIR